MSLDKHSPSRGATLEWSFDFPHADDFEWDEAKAAVNRAKHGVSFDQARDAFDHPFAIDFVDDREDYGGQRLILFGMVESRLLVVAHTLRGDKVRIISAREAEPNERRKYHEENG